MYLQISGCFLFWSFLFFVNNKRMPNAVMSTYRRKVIARISSKAHKVCQFPDNIAGSHKAGQLGTSLHLRICSVDQLPICLSNIPGLPGWNRGSGGTDLHLVCVCVCGGGVVIPLSNNFCSDEGKYPF